MPGQETFHDRADAGRRLADGLREYAGREDVLVLALPRGGVPVGYEVARELGVELDVFLVRKLGVPGHEELAMGAIASGGIRVLDESITRQLQVGEDAIARVAADAQQELERHERVYREVSGEPAVEGRTVILVDDGAATGSTMRAACMAVGGLDPARVVVAVPVAAPTVCDGFRDLVDDVHCAFSPEDIRAVGVWYEDFAQVSDEEVLDLLERARWEQAARRDTA
jgi:putative phosphoribosyl transferase